MRNWRRIRDDDGGERENVEAEATRGWANAINERLTIDCTQTDTRRFGKKALDHRLVKITWTGRFKDGERLLTEWYKRQGVLVGISWANPSGIAG